MTRAAIGPDESAPQVQDQRQDGTSVCVVGPGTRFLSGITYYTFGLVSALAPHHRVSAILLRRLLPRRLYPGRERVGADLTALQLPAYVPAAGRVDWYWGPGMWEAIRLLLRQRPQVMVLQWWSGAVLHTYLLLALVARWLGVSLVVEFHEVLDTGEDRLGWVRRYVDLLGPRLWHAASAFVVHNQHDRNLVVRRHHIDQQLTVLIPHPGYDHLQASRGETQSGPVRLLFFGVVRPFKGVEDLITAFGLVARTRPGDFQLTVIGETWEGWTQPEELIARCPERQWIRRVARYVTDAEAEAAFGAADVVVLPYRRCSSSGPLHIAMAMGLPVVATRVGGIPEATASYPGAVLAEPADPESLARAILAAAQLRGRRFTGAPSWQETASKYSALFQAVLAGSVPDLEGSRGGHEDGAGS